MSFEKGRRLSRWLLFSGTGCLLVGVLFGNDLPEITPYLTWGALLIFACGIIAVFSLCRCPHCGRAFVVGVLTRKDCPRCHKPLLSQGGKKMSKSLQKKR